MDSAFEAEVAEFPSRDLMQCPYDFYAHGRSGAPVQAVPGKDTYLVFRHEDIAQVFRDTDQYSVVFEHSQSTEFFEYGDATHLLGTDAPDHKPKRALTSRPFTPGRLKPMEPKIHTIVDELIDGFIDRGHVELVSEFAYPMPAKVICRLMGLATSGSAFDLIHHWTHELVRVSGPDEHDADPAVMRGVSEYIAREVSARHADPGDDIISEFIQRQSARDGHADLPLAITIALEMLAGGVLTTAQMVSSAMLLLLQQPDQLAYLRAHPSRIVPMLEETLRIEAPVQYRPRRAVRDTELGGVAIPAGATVILIVGSGNRDEREFDCPAQFTIGRPNVKRHFAFGLGVHFCVGAPLARLEGKVAFERLLARLDPIALRDPDAEVANADTRFFRVPATLELAFGRA